ncbi:hypothetical protein IGI04_008888 [Brassica rapa subsp. trilocularis]|uniref:Uncharacterized protein n=1 Tax=Brassica rapa subsp. trilocularis TaxID=1813537 RepID=A0ABQ7MVQ4_BRACM|nr:hypothetical protein IGI04_008888 [Brassica rapa subsp. trilocularis]
MVADMMLLDEKFLMYNYVGLNSPTATRVLKAALSDQHVRIQDAVNERHSYSMEPKKLLKKESLTA